MTEEPVLIVPYRDGPYLVRGPVVLRDQTGAEIDAGRRVVALCRCGKSRLRPFCDGSHHLIQFRAPSEREDRVAVPAAGPTGSGAAKLGGEALIRRSPKAMLDTASREADRELATLYEELLTLRARLMSLEQGERSDGAGRQLADAARCLAAACAAFPSIAPEAVADPDG